MCLLGMGYEEVSRKRTGISEIISFHYTTLGNVGFVKQAVEAMEGFGGIA